MHDMRLLFIDGVSIEQCNSDASDIVATACITLLAVVFSIFSLQAFAWWRISKKQANTCIKLVIFAAIAIVSCS